MDFELRLPPTPTKEMLDAYFDECVSRRGGDVDDAWDN